MTEHNAITDIPFLIERMHRRYLDVVRHELIRQGIDDISPVQALMLANIGDDEIAVRDLIERGYYLGSNASYNLKHLQSGGYIRRSSSERDRRAARISLSDKGKAILNAMAKANTMMADLLLKTGIAEADFEQTYKTLRRIERRWSDALRFSADLDQGEF